MFYNSRKYNLINLISTYVFCILCVYNLLINERHFWGAPNVSVQKNPAQCKFLVISHTKIETTLCFYNVFPTTKGSCHLVYLSDTQTTKTHILLLATFNQFQPPHPSKTANVSTYNVFI